MTVRARLALTILLTGLLTALAVIATVVTHPDLLALHGADPEGFTGFLRNLLLFEPDSRLYLPDADGTVLARSGDMPLVPGLKVKLGPVQEAVMVVGDRACRLRDGR